MIIAGAAAGACAHGPGAFPRPRAETAAIHAASDLSCEGASNAEPLGHTGAGATLALARVGGRRVAYVADEDGKTLLTVDLDSRAQLAETPLAATPSQVYVALDGRVLVTLRDKNELLVLRATDANAPLTKRCSVPTPAEPIAIAASPKDASFVVTSGWGQRLTEYDGRSLLVRFETRLPREPRSAVVSEDGKTAFVSHAVGSVLSVVDLVGAKHEASQVSLRGQDPRERKMFETRRRELAKDSAGDTTRLDDLDAEQRKAGERHPSCQGFALAKSSSVSGRIFAPQVLVDPGDLEGRPDGYGDENEPTESAAVAVIDEGAKAAMTASLSVSRLNLTGRRGNDARDPRPECLLPRAATIDAKTKSLLVTCYGFDAVVAYDATSANPLTSERRRWTVGAGPSGIAVDSEKHRGVVWSQFDRTLSTFPLGGTELVDDKVSPSLVQKTVMPPLREKLAAEYALGRILFHAAGDARIASDGRACASCHPDGRDDAITWATPEGPRRSMMLAGRVTRSAPYSWNGNESTLHSHLGNTFDRLSGRGLRSIELDSLVTYISQMPTPAVLSRDQPSVDRGKQIFTSNEAGCSGCHSGESYTDGKNHDVGSKHSSDRDGQFNTPTLHLVGGTGPWFHDGRYSTLGELLRKSDGKMGKTAHLDAGDINALEAFLRTL